MLVSNISIRSQTDKELSEQLNLEQKVFDNAWLYSKISEGWLSQEAYTNLYAIRDLLQHIYPENWDLQVTVRKHTVNITRERNPDDYLPYGAYFEYETKTGHPTLFSDRTEYYRLASLGAEEEQTQETHIHTLNFNIVVKFPEISIVNSRGETHVIKDLYFKIEYTTSPAILGQTIDEDIIENINFHALPGDSQEFLVPNTTDCSYVLRKYKIQPYMYGARGKISTLEYNKNYAHSHLTGRSTSTGSGGHFTDFESCCLGSGEINQTFAMLSSDFNIQLFQLLLYQVDAYAKWESIEGRPYKTIKELQIAGSRVENPSELAKDTYQKFYRNLVASLKDKISREEIDSLTMLDWVYQENKLSIVDNDKIQRFCRIANDVNDNRYPEHTVYNRDSNGTLYLVNKNTRLSDLTIIPHLSNNDRKYIIFRGQRLHLSVYPIVPTAETVTEFIINPHVLNFIKEKLENYANYVKIKRDTIKRASRFSNIYSRLPQNQTPVPENSQG